VNGVSHAALEGMPAAGDLRVPENCWFAWTEFAIYGHGNVNANTIADARVQAGMVTRDSLLGAPFRWWFWRNQALP